MQHKTTWAGIIVLQTINMPLYIQKIQSGAGFTLWSSLFTVVGLGLLFVDCWINKETPFIFHIGIGIIVNTVLLFICIF